MRIFPTPAFVLTLAAWPTLALAQPAAAPTARPKTPLFSVAELEEFLGGRTLVTLDLKDATMEQVAAALQSASGQKIVARPPLVRAARRAVTPPAETVAAPLFSFSTAKMPFWEAMRAWQLTARGPELEDALAPPQRLVFGRPFVPNSLGVTKNASGWWLQPDNTLADGHAVAAWPFLMIASNLKRNQDGTLRQGGLRDTAPRDTAPKAAPLPVVEAKTGAVQTPAMPAAVKIPTPEIERWRDGLTLSGQLFFDPKLLPAALRYEITEARDDKGNDLHFAGEVALRESALTRKVIQTSIAESDTTRPILTGNAFGIPLRSKPGMGKRLVRLRGVLRFNVVTRSQHWETTELDKPTGGAIFQNGGDFGVQFKGLTGNSSLWSADFAAQSRGAHLEGIWRNRPATGSARRGTLDWSNSGSGDNWATSFAVGDAIGNNGSWGNILNFEGTPRMSLVDENGVVFEQTTGTQVTNLRRDAPGAPPQVVPAPDISPQPPEDVAQNWTYSEERSLYFQPGYDITAQASLTMGRPVKLMLDLPLERREVEIPFEFTDLPLPPS